MPAPRLHLPEATSSDGMTDEFLDGPGGMQVGMVIDPEELVGMQARADTLRHALIDSYLVEPYLEESYLASRMAAYAGMQAKMVIADHERVYGMQAQMHIDTDRTLGQQARMFIVDHERPYGMQARLVQIARTSLQTTMIIYNQTQFRVLYTFPSRGTADLLGDNWSASNQASGDFLPRNLNTDVEEEVFRAALNSVELICDSGVTQGVTFDLLSLRNHNLTRDAFIQVQGSQDAGFATVNVSITITSELLHIYYVAPTFPTAESFRNRYWKFIINDPTNPSPVQIGAILFGNAKVFSMKDSWDNPIRSGKRHYKDVLPTEGMTNDMNHRAVKRWLRLSFTDLERINGNFRLLDEWIDYCRTSLKALVVPMPLQASRYAVFAKLVQMQDFEASNQSNIDDPAGFAEYIAIVVELDEAL